MISLPSIKFWQRCRGGNDISFWFTKRLTNSSLFLCAGKIPRNYQLQKNHICMCLWSRQQRSRGIGTLLSKGTGTHWLAALRAAIQSNYWLCFLQGLLHCNIYSVGISFPCYLTLHTVLTQQQAVILNSKKWLEFGLEGICLIRLLSNTIEEYWSKGMCA